VKREAIYFAKITRPSAEGILPRRRLFQLLDRARHHPILWVSGPPGSGKTTLVASYLDSRKLPCLWYQVDEGDSDIASFFFYLGLAAKKASPRFRKPLPLLTPEYLMGIPTFTLRFFENLYGRLKTPFFIVFDNYHRLALDSPFHEVILNGLSIIPRGINVILISRRESPAVFARLHVHDQMEFMEWNELRFTLEESRDIVRLRAPKILSKEVVKRLHQITDGWVAGLILVSDAVRRGIELQFLEKSSSKEIVDYFGSEIFTKMSEETQTFLMKTAFLPGMTVQMAENLSGITNGEVILTSLTRNNYFIEQHHSVVPVYQYHPLFRNFLLSRAKESFSREALLDLHHRAALLLEESGQMEEAAQIYMDQKNWEGLTRLIMKHAPSLLAQGRYQPLEKWLTCLPKNLLENTAWLLFWLGSCRLPFDPSSSHSCLEKAFERFRKEGDIAGVFLSWAGIVDVIDFSHNDFSLLDHWIHTLEDLLHDIKEFPSQEIGARVASSMVSALTLRQPQHPEFHKWTDQAFSLTESPQLINIRMWVLFHLVLHGCFMGKFERAGHNLDLLSQLTGSRDAPPFPKIMGKVADSIYYQFTGSHEKCMKAVSEGMDMSRRTGIHNMDHPLLAHAISSSLNVNDFETAWQSLDRLASSLNRPLTSDNIFEIRNRLIYHSLSARYALAYGDLAELTLHVDLALKYGNQVGAPLLLSTTHLMSALAMHRLGKKEEALDQLRKGTLIALETKSKILEFGSLLAQSYFAFDQGEEASGLHHLKMAFALGKDQRLLNTFFDDPSATARLCTKALEAEIEVEYVQEIIRKRHLIPDKGLLQLERWPWPMKIYTLGRFVIHKDGNPLPTHRKAQQRPLDMLKVLVALGGRGIREEEISDILWPEADGDAAHMSVTATLHRLRQLLGREDAIRLSEGRLTLNERICWVDLWAFERYLEEADLQWRDGFSERATVLTEKALELYRGPFLGQEMEQPWTMAMSERTRSKFLRGVRTLSDYWCQTNQWEKARECYQKGLDVDDLAEELCRGLMNCYQNLGLKAEALSFYRRFEKRLKTVLEIEPSPKTKALHDALLATN
jgi:ATP/maltotriose-dependent transcriptional regulator MalT/DNA-binding SARP family transcriptional activator